MKEPAECSTTEAIGGISTTEISTDSGRQMKTEKNLLDLLDMKHLMTFQTVILQRGRGRSHVKGVKQRMCEQEVKAEFVL